MVDIAAIAGAAGNLKTAGEILKSMIGLKISAEMQSKVIELQTVIMSAQSDALSAQMAQSSLAERVRLLEAELASMKAWDGEKERYHLTSVGSGAFAYAQKETVESAEPPHWLCVKCYEQSHKSILQSVGRTPDKNSTIWACPSCKAQILTFWSVNPASHAKKEIERKLGPGEKCDKCGADELRLVREENDRIFGVLGGRRQYLKCRSCSFETERVRE